MILSDGTVVPFATQALGETIPTLSNGYFYAETGLDLSGKFATYGALYRAQPSVATVVDKISAAAARLTVKVWDNTPESGKILDTESDLAKLIARPCTEMSSFNFWRWTVSTYEIYGEAFWYKQRNTEGKVVNLLPMHPSRVAVHRTPLGEVEYIFTLGVAAAGILKAPASDVVAFQRYNPDSLMRGFSRLESLRTTLLNEDASRRATQSWWKRGARPSVFLKHPGELSQQAQDRLRANFDARHAGSDNAGSTAILEEGMEAQVVQLSAEEMQYIEGRKMNLQEVCMVFDVPPPVVHILDHATFSNITEQMRSMYRDTMAPRLEDIESVIDFSLRSEFAEEGTVKITFSLDEVLRGDFETRASSVQTLINTGVMKPSEARPLFDLPEADEAADRLYANAALVELGLSSEQMKMSMEAAEAQATGQQEPMDEMSEEGEPGEAGEVEEPGENEDGGSESETGGPEDGTEEDDTEEETKKVLDVSEAIQRSLMGRVGRKAAVPEAKQELVNGHKKELDSYFEAQKSSVVESRSFDPKAWNPKLATVLAALGTVTSKAIGQRTATELGSEYNSGELSGYVKANAKIAAKKINWAILDKLTEQGDLDQYTDEELATIFDEKVSYRSSEIATTRVAIIAGLAALYAARQAKAKYKTWVTTSDNPRSSHAQVAGETVPIDEKFSNGMEHPGDYEAGAENVANCQCYIEYSTED